MTLIRCSACKGMKNIMGMGMTTKKCGACNAIGYIKEEPKEIKKDETASLDEAVTKIQHAMVDDKKEVSHARKST